MVILPVAIIGLMIWALWAVNHSGSGDDDCLWPKSRKSKIGLLVLWLILLAMTITVLAMGEKPENLIGEFLGLASPLIVFLTSRKRK